MSEAGGDVMDIILGIGFLLMCAAGCSIGVMFGQLIDWCAEDQRDRDVVVNGKSVKLLRTLWQAL